MRAGAYTVNEKMLRREMCARVLPDRIGRNAQGRWFQWDTPAAPVGYNNGMPWGRPFLPVLKRTRQELELKGVEVFAYLGDVSIEHRNGGNRTRYCRSCAVPPL